MVDEKNKISLTYFQEIHGWDLIIQEEMRNIFGEDYYIELQDHGIEEQKNILPKLLELSRVTGIPMVATNDVHYLKKSDAELWQMILMIASLRGITLPKAPPPHEEFEKLRKALGSAEQANVSEALRIIDQYRNTQGIN